MTDPRTGKRYHHARAVRGPNVTIWDAIRVRDQLRSEGRDRAAGTIRSLPLWSDYAVSLLEAKAAEGRLTSSKSRERWGTVLKRLIPVFGRLHVDELRMADIVAWRDQVARWLRDGMPSMSEPRGAATKETDHVCDHGDHGARRRSGRGHSSGEGEQDSSHHEELFQGKLLGRARGRGRGRRLVQRDDRPPARTRVDPKTLATRRVAMPPGPG